MMPTGDALNIEQTEQVAGVQLFQSNASSVGDSLVSADSSKLLVEIYTLLKYIAGRIINLVIGEDRIMVINRTGGSASAALISQMQTILLFLQNLAIAEKVQVVSFAFAWEIFSDKVVQIFLHSVAAHHKVCQAKD